MKKFSLTMMIIFALALTACATSDQQAPQGDETELEESANEPASQESAVDGESINPEDILTVEYENAASLRNQLALGILALQDAPQAATTEQAAELLPLWQAMAALEQGQNVAQAEIEALQSQLIRGMSVEQLQTIAALNLTNDDLAEFYAEFGIVMGSETGETQGMQGANKDMTEEERAAFRATRQASEAGVSSGTGGTGRERRSILTNEVIALLTALMDG